MGESDATLEARPPDGPSFSPLDRASFSPLDRASFSPLDRATFSPLDRPSFSPLDRATFSPLDRATFSPLDREAPRPRPSRSLTGALVVVLLVNPATPARATAGAPAAASPELARQAYARRDFVRAVRLYEALFAATGAAKFLFNAGMAREAAGHDGQALLHWREYLRLAGDIAADEREQLSRQMAAAQRRTAHVRLLVASARPVVLDLRRDGAGDSDPIRVTVQGRMDLDLEPGPWTAAAVGSSRPPDRFVAAVTADAAPQECRIDPGPPPAPAARPITVRFGPRDAVRGGVAVSFSGPRPVPARTVRTPATSLQLSPEPWVVRARSPGYLPAEVALGPTSPPAVDIELRRDWAGPLNTGLGLGFAVGGAGLLAVGVTLAARGAREYHNIRAAIPDDRPLTRSEADTLLWSTRAKTTGFGLIGAGLGAGVAALTNGLGGDRRALAAEAGIGAALTLVGAIGLPLTKAGYRHDTTPSTATLADLRDRRLRDHAFGAALGGGLGLLAGALAALVVRAVIRRTTRHPQRLQVSPRTDGLALHGRF